jgi:hypothetical protein
MASLPDLVIWLWFFMVMPCLVLFGGVYLHARLTNDPRRGWSHPPGWLSTLTIWDLAHVIVGFAVYLWARAGVFG